MKVLYLSPGCFDMGGISRYNRYQIKALRELLGENNVRALSLLGREEGGFKEDFEVHWSANGVNPLNKIKFILKTIYEAISWKPQIIFCAHVNLSGLSHLTARIVGAKSVLNTYGLEVWSGLSKDASWGLRNSDHVISDCHFTANYLENEGIRKANTTTVIWDCVNLQVFKPKQINPAIIKKYNIPDPDKHFIILTLGRLSDTARHKGYERLLKVFSEVAKIEENARLIFAGKGNIIPELQEKARHEGIGEKVYFIGRIEDEDMADVYSSAHVFSLVSDRGKGRGEGIPLTPLEAMACEVPIIVGNQDGSQEAVIEEKNGFVIDPFDLDRHVSIIESLISSPQLLQSKRKNAAKIIKEYFSYEGFVQKHHSFFQKIKL